ncbi:MAG TPA: rhodanese-like domain-containing protein [Bacteroidota bacterium]|nr:rhodanese-like domain-containing protein [Bacteroidota bacterium]
MSTIEEKIKSGALIVDVRTAEEFEEEHFPNALNIPVDQVQQRISEFGAKDKPVVLYCASGARSAYATRMLRSMGYTDVVNAGGLSDMPGM